MKKVQKEAKAVLKKAQEEMKQQVDKERSEAKESKKGDKIMLRTKNWQRNQQINMLVHILLMRQFLLMQSNYDYQLQ